MTRSNQMKFRLVNMRYWPSVRSRWLDIGQVLFLRLYHKKERGYLSFSHHDRTHLVNKGFIVRPKRQRFPCGTNGNHERARKAPSRPHWYPIRMQDSIYLAHSWFRHIIIRNKSSKVGVEGKINATEATCKRWKRKLLGGPGACPLEKFWDLGLLVCISSILERKLECLNRTQTSLIFGFGRGWGGGG